MKSRSRAGFCAACVTLDTTSCTGFFNPGRGGTWHLDMQLQEMDAFLTTATSGAALVAAAA